MTKHFTRSSGDFMGCRNSSVMPNSGSWWAAACSELLLELLLLGLLPVLAEGAVVAVSTMLVLRAPSWLHLKAMCWRGRCVAERWALTRQACRLTPA
jgi:hypothetical protein